MQEKKQSFIRMKYGYEYYKDPAIVPITGVAEALGIDIFPGGRITCPCPDHADNNPSCVISDTGRTSNHFKCFSCGEGGGVLELVIAVKGGLSPSEYWRCVNSSDPELNKKAREKKNEALLYIEELYPGNIEVSDKPFFSKDDFPEIPGSFWRKIGVRDPGIPAFAKYQTGWKIDGNVHLPITESREFKISLRETADVMLSLIMDHKRKLNEYLFGVFEKFPDIDVKNRIYMSDVTDKELEECENYENELRDWLTGHSKKEDLKSELPDETEIDEPGL